jgi:2-keto-4-pentenoate hydratase/2-oxohepta-3-ene-1,7-dioic acid hydratase in catechol pathway
MRRSLAVATVLLLAGTLAAASGPGAARGASVEIAPLADAITFARTRGDSGPRVLAVTRYAGGVVAGVDLSALLGRPISDPIDALRDEGWEALRDRIAAAPDAARVTTAAVRLALPVDLRDHHVAAGTNYPEHAGEAEVEDGPFLFAKLVRPTGPRAPVPAGDALLDYEVELAFVTLEPLAEGERPATTGLVVCNDYTDRATLLRHVDVWNPASGTGFTTGKSFPGYLPVGDLFVVPRDVRAFVASLELRLDVNGEPRQRARVSEWIWDLDRILAETWARRDATWEHRGRDVSLLSAEKTLPDRTLVMAGTPAGTVFRGIDFPVRARGALAWVLGGWDVPLPRRVVEAYVHEAREAGVYLAPGDRVAIHADRLGVVENEIVP